MSNSIPTRSEIPVEYTWDLASVFPSDEAWEAAIKTLITELSTLKRFQGQLGNNPTTLADWFEALEKVTDMIGKIYVYGSNSSAEDTTNQANSAKADRSRSLYAQTMASIAFAEPEILSIGFDTLQKWMNDEPRLKIFAHYFDTVKRRQAHIRSAEVEELLGLVEDTFRTSDGIHKILTDADLTFEAAQPSEEGGKPLPIAQGTIGALVTHTDRGIRQTAWQNYMDAHLAYKNTMASCLTTAVKQHAFTAKARRYKSSFEAALETNHIPLSVYYNLIETYRRNLPTWHRYWRIRRQVLGYNALHEYDVKAPLTKNPPQIPFEQAAKWICDGMKPLGTEYVSTMQRGLLKERWVDIYPNKGKRAGAFSSGVQGTHPFILMSYTDDIFSLSTLAHELGHSMHSYYSWQTQPFIYARYGLFVAEVASNFNQALVRAHLLNNTSDPEFQIAIIEEAMSNFHRYFFIMPILAQFEYEIHRRVENGKALPADELIDLMANLFAEGYGDEIEIDRERTGITWGTFSLHMYINFYVYQYATGIAGAHALAKNVLTGKTDAVKNYLRFLQSGGSRYPLDTLKLAGVDLNTPEPIEQTFDVLAQLVNRLEALTLTKQENK